ncbi:MAG: hypothetical protein KUG77_03750, partial [Nannocystaceae bacterium]|nr:hypothetical protein [Nannocystaceae bacterium]
MPLLGMGSSGTAGICGGLIVLALAGCEGGTGTSVEVPNPLTDPAVGPPAGNPDGACDIPAAAGLEDISAPTTVVGDGTPASCTADGFIHAVASGGVITFDCGP